jgi:hypothetical protein
MQRGGFGNREERDSEPCLLRIEIIEEETCPKRACQTAKELQRLDLWMTVENAWYPRFST